MMSQPPTATGTGMAGRRLWLRVGIAAILLVLVGGIGIFVLIRARSAEARCTGTSARSPPAPRSCCRMAPCLDSPHTAERASRPRRRC